MQDFEYIKGQRSGNILVNKNYLFNLDRTSGGVNYWRCRTRGCRAKCIVNSENLLTTKNEHSHAPLSDEELEKMKTLASLKNSSRMSGDRTQNVVTRQLVNLNNEVIQIMPKERSLSRAVQRERANELSNIIPTLPEIPERLWNNSRGECFYQRDSGYGDINRHVIFMSDFQKNVLKKAKTWIIDGTFKSVPNQFHQLVTIQGLYLGKFWPCIHALMVNKSEMAYNLLFEQIKTMVGSQSDNIVMDFEKGLNNSANFIFDMSDIFGCNFHFGQLIWKKIQNVSLTVAYKELTWQRKILRRCFLLAFIPIDNVLMEFEKITFDANKFDRDERIVSFLIYFRKQFIAGENQPDPAYPIKFWSCYERIQGSIPRTTNSLEGWHRQLNSSFNSAHPNLAVFLEVLCREEQRAFVKMTQIKFGNYIEITTTDFKKEQELKVLISNFKEFDIINYFKLIDRLLNFKIE